ncbi:hematopoietic progenitor cell antigen CD34 [Catharus ustulatus]|nr:hematopoietic progenitor cell antigen CD34 [Catharus ustulatus]XP_032936225.1 hematopoietic progenitor cell antigen CD34 [Catharus ustulatus]
MEWRQLLCISVCLLELAGCAAQTTTDTPTPTGTAGTPGDSSSDTASNASTPSTATGDTSSATATSAGATAGPVATKVTSTESSGQEGMSPQPSTSPTSLTVTPMKPDRTPGVSTTQSPPGTQPKDGAHTLVPTVARTSSAATQEQRAVTNATTALHSPEPTLPAIQCHTARGEGDTGAICLQLNQSSSCEQFLGSKGFDLFQAICGNRSQSVDSPCEIKLTPSSLDSDCLLLTLKGEKDPDKLLHVLQKSDWEKFGIASLKKESGRSQQDPARRTLIALVTSGLLLALLGLAGYFLMKRRSWSPAGERLAEDPYYTEHGSQGNTLLMTPSQEPAELQEKPNVPSLNGATQENGTGQASSKNGHSGRQHSPADTEM